MEIDVVFHQAAYGGYMPEISKYVAVNIIVSQRHSFWKLSGRKISGSEKSWSLLRRWSIPKGQENAPNMVWSSLG
jgi:hypothetical protein